MNKVEGKNGVTGWLITLGLIVGFVLIAGITYAWDVIVNQDKIPRSVSVGGVDISVMERTAAVDKLEHELKGIETQPVTVIAGALQSEFTPAQSGLSLDNQAAVDAIKEPSLNPITRLASFFRSTEDIPVATDVDDSKLQPTLDRVKAELSTEPVDGMLELHNGELKVTDPTLGQTVDDTELHDAVAANWLSKDGVKVEPEDVEPAINKDAIEKMRTGDAAKALNNPLILKAKNNVTATLNKPEISQFTSIEKKDGRLHLVVDSNRAQQLLQERTGGADVPGVNAKVKFVGGSRQVTPSRDGEIIDWQTTIEGFDKRVISDDREWDATYQPDPAKFTTEDAENATFNDTVGEFSTGGFSSGSGRNIQLVAQAVNGAVVNPGETFSLNGHTGPRGTAQGYAESGIIINGHSGSAVGGGISQFATTLYNAAYFAGMQDTAHTPHSYYISRYPAGREATVYEGAIDLQFTNTFNTPVQIETNFGGGEITVRLKGTKTVEVESINNGRWAKTAPQPMSVPGSDCSPSSGSPGFTTSDTRIIRDLSGRELSRETKTTVYDPQPIVRCG